MKFIDLFYVAFIQDAFLIRTERIRQLMILSFRVDLETCDLIKCPRVLE